MSKGYVYVLSNPSMPGLLKIGRSENDPQIRAQQLYTTGVPSPFTIEFVWFSDDCVATESQIHAAFSAERVRGREFFKTSVGEVIEWLTSCLFVDHGLAIVSEQVSADASHLDYLSSEFGLTASEIICAASEIPKEEMHALYERYKGRQRGYAPAVTIEIPDVSQKETTNVLAFAGAQNGQN